jgi:hypothetical protein
MDILSEVRGCYDIDSNDSNLKTTILQDGEIGNTPVVLRCLRRTAKGSNGSCKLNIYIATKV